ncbi:membrane protein FAM174A [Scyliorhinus canicula]|uniref:membrane protein FAM174A n=1 Tax=Scyliorhinus canicula TaxID=7830 RepID=UPI0018F6170E|nr:membrane protein FAM174A [Scyliorhinus canicula]
MWPRLYGNRLLWLLMWVGDTSMALAPLRKRQGNRTDSVTVKAPGSQANSSTGLSTVGKRNKGDEHSNASPVEQTMMIQRALYVLVVVTALVVIYFVVRTIRMRRINRKNRKYGILNTNLGNMEMKPLDQEDDDEDDTLFDAHHARR